MQVTLDAGPGASCTLKQTTCSSSVAFVLPIDKTAFLAGLSAFLSEPETMEASIEDILVTQNRDGVYLHAGGGKFHLPWPVAAALVID